MSEQENEHNCDEEGCQGGENVVVSAQIVVTQGFDEEGAPQVWVSYPEGVALVTALGMLEAAKAHIVAGAYAT